MCLCRNGAWLDLDKRKEWGGGGMNRGLFQERGGKGLSEGSEGVGLSWGEGEGGHVVLTELS